MSIFVSEHQIVRWREIIPSSGRRQGPIITNGNNAERLLATSPLKGRGVWVPAPRAQLRTKPGRRESYFACPALANSVLVSCPPSTTSTPAASGSSDSTSKPVEVLPVASLTQPTRYGPPNPWRLPLQLIR